MIRLSKNFTLDEFTHSRTAAELGIDNTPSLQAIVNLTRLADELQYLRDCFGRPVVITSGYRSPELNEAVGGVQESAHVWGRAADFYIPGVPLREVMAEMELKTCWFDQVILEHDEWIHYAIPAIAAEAREQMLEAIRIDGRTAYVEWGADESRMAHRDNRPADAVPGAELSRGYRVEMEVTPEHPGGKVVRAGLSAEAPDGYPPEQLG